MIYIDTDIELEVDQLTEYLVQEKENKGGADIVEWLDLPLMLVSVEMNS